MNNRIKELAEQATEYNEQTLTGWLNPEKFAELIVRECAELTLDYKNEQHYQGWLDYRDEIKRQFGVLNVSKDN